MKVEFGEIKLIQYENAYPQSGAFAIRDEWYNCREQFSHTFNDTVEGLFFAHPSTDLMSERVASFILKTEEILKVSMKLFSYTEFCLTNRPYALWVVPSKFWMSCSLRRSLFTALLRCGIEYDLKKDNYEQALYESKYIKDTKPAMMRFLFGFTNFNIKRYSYIENYPSFAVSGANGWQKIFSGKNIEQIRELLEPSQDRFVEPSLVGQGSVWN